MIRNEGDDLFFFGFPTDTSKIQRDCLLRWKNQSWVEPPKRAGKFHLVSPSTFFKKNFHTLPRKTNMSTKHWMGLERLKNPVRNGPL